MVVEVKYGDITGDSIAANTLPETAVGITSP
jgi:hypothetical protein